MNVIIFILLLAAALCFLAAMARIAAKVDLIALGLLLWVVTVLIKAGQALH